MAGKCRKSLVLFRSTARAYQHCQQVELQVAHRICANSLVSYARPCFILGVSDCVMSRFLLR